LQLCLEKKAYLLEFFDPNLQQAQALNKSYPEKWKFFLILLILTMMFYPILVILNVVIITSNHKLRI
ncbi:MAG: hypothetical protein ACFFG0_29175, partial [Candidatus Thorarchaeota archaeon]